MKNTLVYDLPTRFFHWIFAGLFVAIISIVKLTDDESPLFQWHMLLGLILGFVATYRIIWGLIGSKFARFSSFPLSPKSLISYFKGMFQDTKPQFLGHNPASAWAGLTMIILAIGLALTGFLMASGFKEQLEDIHEILANGFFIIAIAHILGLIFHQIKHRDCLPRSMLNGKKNWDSIDAGIKNQGLVAGLVFLGLTATFGAYIFSGYQSATGQVQIFGRVLQLGENESEENEKNNQEKLISDEKDGEDVP